MHIAIPPVVNHRVEAAGSIHLCKFNMLIVIDARWAEFSVNYSYVSCSHFTDFDCFGGWNCTSMG